LFALTNRLLPEPNPEAGSDYLRGWETETTVADGLLTKLSAAAAEKNNEGDVLPEFHPR
jgi:hypothetical protein